MKRAVVAMLLGLCAGVAVTWTVLRREQVSPPIEEKAEPPSEDKGAQTGLRIEASAQAAMGLKVQTLSEARVAPELQVYGRVLDPAPLLALLMEKATNSADVDLSSREWKRLEMLHGQDQNISTRALEVAKAQALRDQTQFESVRLRILAQWGQYIANLKNPSDFIRPLVKMRSALVRLDLPLDFDIKTVPSTARLATSSDINGGIEAKFLGELPTTDAQLQTLGVLFLLNGKAPPVGTNVVAWLRMPGDVLTGVVVPRSALLRHQGFVVVYVKRALDRFERTRVEPARETPAGWLVTSGLKPGDTVVTTGAQQLLSAEFGGMQEE